MINLATLIGAGNLQMIIIDNRNSHVVTENNNVFEVIKNTADADFSKVVGIGSYKDCFALVRFLQLQKLATS